MSAGEDAQPATGAENAEPRPLDEAAASLATHVGELADTLPEEDRQALAALLLRAMDPVSRRRWEPASALDADEEAVLADLVQRAGARGARDGDLREDASGQDATTEE